MRWLLRVLGANREACTAEPRECDQALVSGILAVIAVAAIACASGLRLRPRAKIVFVPAA
ncbi:hypothetical protein BA177_15695 [Woeseia oceani]|uniref:Uncharacterized protein n=1 Tax=Woeseia oceani TaxID=1548547 RepID=A0A193LJ60_9GAMM|nr:hypothetical protein BA177_15695 [Woeseia oceani]